MQILKKTTRASTKNGGGVAGAALLFKSQMPPSVKQEGRETAGQAVRSSTLIEIFFLRKLKKWKECGSVPGLNDSCLSLFPGSTGEGRGYPLQYSWASLVTQMVKNRHAMWETWVQSQGWKDSLEKGSGVHSSILAWRIPRTKSTGSQRVGPDWATFTFTVPCGPFDSTVGYLILWLIPIAFSLCLHIATPAILYYLILISFIELEAPWWEKDNCLIHIFIFRNI